jgi:hypothetical protein
MISRRAKVYNLGFLVFFMVHYERLRKKLGRNPTGEDITRVIGELGDLKDEYLLQDAELFDQQLRTLAENRGHISESLDARLTTAVDSYAGTQTGFGIKLMRGAGKTLSYIPKVAAAPFVYGWRGTKAVGRGIGGVAERVCNFAIDEIEVVVPALMCGTILGAGLIASRSDNQRIERNKTVFEKYSPELTGLVAYSDDGRFIKVGEARELCSENPKPRTYQLDSGDIKDIDWLDKNQVVYVSRKEGVDTVDILDISSGVSRRVRFNFDHPSEINENDFSVDELRVDHSNGRVYIISNGFWHDAKTLDGEFNFNSNYLTRTKIIPSEDVFNSGKDLELRVGGSYYAFLVAGDEAAQLNVRAAYGFSWNPNASLNVEAVEGLEVLKLPEIDPRVSESDGLKSSELKSEVDPKTEEFSPVLWGPW